LTINNPDQEDGTLVQVYKAPNSGRTSSGPSDYIIVVTTLFSLFGSDVEIKTITLHCTDHDFPSW